MSRKNTITRQSGPVQKGSRMHANTVRALMAAGAVLFAAGCAEKVEEINTVQPHFVKKSLFEGEWYYRQTIVDATPEIADIVFVGLDGNLDKVYFDLSDADNYLTVKRTYEPVPGLNQDDARQGGDINEGEPVITFMVDSHFDIIRGYNATTGERTNVIQENTTDRPWFEREYVRVDWSAVSSTGWDTKLTGFMNFVGALHDGGGATDYVRENDPYDPDHVVITEDTIQVTQTYRVSPNLTFNCYYAYGNFNCGSGEVKIRHSFSRIDPNDAESFEPREYMDVVELRDDEGRKIRTRPLPADSLFAIQDNTIDTIALGGECQTPVQCRGDLTCVNRDGAQTCQETCQNHNECGAGRGCLEGACTETLVEVACTPELKSYLDELFYEDWLDPETDCWNTLQEEQFGRFGYFRTERFGYDRRLGPIDANREFYANVHHVWETAYEMDANGDIMRDENGEKVMIPVAERNMRPIVYYLNVGYPEDLKDLTAQISGDWNDVFMNGAMSATGKDAATIQAQLASSFTANGDMAVWLPGDELQSSALYQIRDNNCSLRGVRMYLEQHPKLAWVVEEATEGMGLGADTAPNTLKRACAGLEWHGRDQGMDDVFTWQNVGDIRYNFVYWVNEDQPGGPLGFGPSSKDPENGRILSANAYVYGAAVDRYARFAADVVMSINDDEYLNGIANGESYLQWVDEDLPVAGESFYLSPDFKRAMDDRFGALELNDKFDPMTDVLGTIDPAVATRFARGQMQGAGRLEANSNFEMPSEAAAKLERAKADPRIRSLILNDNDLAIAERLMGPDVDGNAIAEDVEELAMDLALDPRKFHQRLNQRNKFYMDRNMYMADFLDDSVIGQAMALRDQDAETIYQTLRRDIYRAVMLHEIGHTVGLTHNFAASFDALNYQDEYWQIRQNYDEAAWNEQRLPEFRYASIMDYGARFNSDTKGLGKYDNAAIKFGYFSMVESWDDSVPQLTYYDTGISNLIHGYEVMPDLVGGNIENLTGRFDRPLAEVMEERREGVFGNTEKMTGNSVIGPTDWYVDRTVPFEYCADIYNGNLTCRTWDEGANHAESVASAIQNYWNYHRFNSYRRGRNEFSFINSFFSRQSRLQAYLTYPFRFYFFYRYSELYLSEDLLQATVLGLNFISKVMGTPEPGRYCLNDQDNTYLPAGFMDQASCDADSVVVSEGVGRKMDIEFSDEYVWYVDYIGSYYDKANFMISLFDTSTLFFRAWLGDSRRFSIGYYRTFRKEIVDLLRDTTFSMLGDMDGKSFNSSVSDKQAVVPPRLVDYSTFGTGLAPETTNMPKLHSGMSYNVAWRALLLSSIFNTATYDSQNDFIEYVTILEAGSGNDRDLPEDAVVVEFVHPTTGVTYRAPQTYENNSISVDLLERANAFKDGTWQPAFDAYQAALESEEPVDDAEIVGLLQTYQDADRTLAEMVDLMADLLYLRKIAYYTTD